MSVSSELSELLRPYYWINLLLSLSYIFAKRTPGVCSTVFATDECELDGRETEILLFVVVVVALRTRKAGALTMPHYLASAFLYTKLANVVLWFYADARAGLAYAALVVLVALLLPQPTYQGPESVVYVRGLTALRDEMARSPDATFLVCFYAAWHPACVHFAPVFSQLSHAYTLPNLRFAKADVGRYPEMAREFRITDGATSRQLPTLVLLRRGTELQRRPHADSRGKLLKFGFSEENVKAAFDLPGLHKECKEMLSARDDKKHQ